MKDRCAAAQIAHAARAGATMHLAAVVLVAAAAWCAPPASAPSTAVVSGAISVSFKSDLGLSIHIAGQGLMQALPPSPFFGGAAHPFPAKLHCSAPGVPVSGGDRFGAYQAIRLFYAVQTICHRVVTQRVRATHQAGPWESRWDCAAV